MKLKKRVQENYQKITRIMSLGLLIIAFGLLAFRDYASEDMLIYYMGDYFSFLIDLSKFVLLLFFTWYFMKIRSSTRFTRVAMLVVLHDVIIIIAITGLIGIKFDDDLIYLLFIVIIFSLNDSLFFYDRVSEFLRLKGSSLPVACAVLSSLHTIISRVTRSSLTFLAFLAFHYFSGLIFDDLIMDVMPVVSIFSISILVRIYSSIFLTGYLAGVIGLSSKYKIRKSIMDLQSVRIHDEKLPSRRLGDPLLFLYPYALGMTQFSLVVSILMALPHYFGGSYYPVSEFQLIQSWSSTTFALVLLTLTLPKMRANAIYLRSFRKDVESEQVRELIEVALGNDYRLAGIRDPNKRVSLIMRPIMYSVMCLQYAGARYLNLEAGNDWLARLWISIGEARVLFLDLRDLTDFVKVEAQLSVVSTSLQQVMFIIDDLKSEDAWREQLAEILKLDDAQSRKLKLVVWSEENKSSFVEQIRTFSENAPEAQGINRSALPMVEASIAKVKDVKYERIKTVLSILAGIVVVALLFFGMILGYFSGIKELALVLTFIVEVFLGYIIVLLLRAVIGKYRKLSYVYQYNRSYRNMMLWELIQVTMLVLVSLLGVGLYHYIIFVNFF